MTAALATPARSRADVSASSRNLAQVLFDQARELLSAGRYAEACQKFGESQRLDPGGGTLLNLALCHEKEGKLATAWTDFREALDAARRDRRGEREKLAREHLDALEPRLPRLTLRVSGSTTNARVEVMLDAIVFDESAWETPVPVDPGGHAIEARALGKKKWTAQVTLREGEQMALVVPTLDDDVRSSTGDSDSSSVVAATGSNGRRTGAYVLGGFGVAALGVGTYFGISALHQRQQADENGCSGNTCRSGTSGPDYDSKAMTSAWISNVAFGVGLISAGVATYWFLTSPARGPSATSSRTPSARADSFPLAVTPLADHGGAFASWRSSW